MLGDALGENALGEFGLGVETITPIPTFDRGWQPMVEPRIEDDDDLLLATWMLYLRQPYEKK